MIDRTKDLLIEAAALSLKKFPPRVVTITQDKAQLEQLYPKGDGGKLNVQAVHEEIDLNAVLEQSFAAGQGVITLSASMTDQEILTLIKGACTWSKCKAFQVIPPKVEIEPRDWSQLKPFTCPYCGSATPEADELVLDAWGHFHCAVEECGARLQLHDSGRAIGYINCTPES